MMPDNYVHSILSNYRHKPRFVVEFETALPPKVRIRELSLQFIKTPSILMMRVWECFGANVTWSDITL